MDTLTTNTFCIGQITMFCFSETCRICKRSLNSVTLTCNSQKGESNAFFRMFPELMNSKLNLFLKNFCESCEVQVLKFEKFKNHCIQSDECYMHYLNQLEGHDGTHADLLCELSIKQEDHRNYDSRIEPTCNNYIIKKASSYYRSAVLSSSAAEDNVKHEICMSDIKEEHEDAMVDEAVSVLGCEEIRDPLALTNQELFAPDYHRSIDEESVGVYEEEIHCIKEEIKLEAVEVSTNDGSNDFHLKINDSSLNTEMENGIISKQEILISDYDESDVHGIITDSSHDISTIKSEYCQGKDDIGNITGVGFTEIDIVKQEVCIAAVEESNNSIDSSVNNNLIQDIDGEKFSLNHDKNMEEYKRTHTENKPHECDICKKSFRHLSKLKMHKRIHTGEKPYECDICKMSFSRPYNLKTHKRIHTGEKTYECDICKKSFLHLNQLKEHKSIHNGKKPYECDICKKSFLHPYQLKEHKSIHTGEKPYECDTCKKRFSCPSKAKKHKRMHTTEKSYECGICKQSFLHPYSLLRHKRSHTGEKPYECDICKKSFSQKDVLILHKRNHSGEKPHECDICNRSFSHKYTLIEHKRTHTGEKPYQCDICKKSFAYKNILVCHRRTHTGEKPYECDICKKSFSRSYHLQIHKRNHSGEKPYKCDLCKRSFVEKTKLNKHRKACCFQQK